MLKYNITCIYLPYLTKCTVYLGFICRPIPIYESLSVLEMDLLDYVKM
jgi:hypothetical protein